ncbi:hydrolase [uncultured Lacinutrix sp.]|uniref:hydrolase n=1 Tax=uncultured Lacinutrix sp. TaxID=574032 RepID=UPI002638B9A3|nr:hydrolase [uncultured Lacinutrix sp.]
MNSKNIFDDSNRKVENSKIQIKKYQDSILVLNDKIADLSYFTFDSNDKSYFYFQDKGFNVEELLRAIQDGLYSQNVYEGEEHPIVPYGSSEGNKMQINIVRILNHKWIIADFADGQFEGELFITYNINEKGELKYNLAESFLYPLD